jgi:hypothetical protein
MRDGNLVESAVPVADPCAGALSDPLAARVAALG